MTLIRERFDLLGFTECGLKRGEGLGDLDVGLFGGLPGVIVHKGTDRGTSGLLPDALEGDFHSGYVFGIHFKFLS